MGEVGALSPALTAVSTGVKVACPGVLLTPRGLAGASTVAHQGLGQELAGNDSQASIPPIVSSLDLS